METKQLNTWQFAEQNLICFITVGVKCKTCGTTWGIRLNKELPIEENLKRIPIQKYVCMECSKKLEKPLSEEMVKI